MHNFLGGFDLQDNDSASEMTDRVLSMLYQFLLSNQTLHLNESFQIYLKILSVEHSKLKSITPRNQKKKVKRNFNRVHLGQSKRVYNYKWGIDIPQICSFINKCLLTCTILGLAQHEYFENRKNRKFLYMSLINSKIESKRNYAIKIMSEELSKLFSVIDIKQTGPYELKTTIILLSAKYKCQFFIFDSLNHSSKIYLMYPQQFNDTLKPIYLYRPSFDSCHVLFIRNLTSFFKANGDVCLSCFRIFRNNRYSRSPHLCRKKQMCFACRRFFEDINTYKNTSTAMNFCDKMTTLENTFHCPKCNCDIYSAHCFKGHKKFCKSRGYFGYKCSQCNKFTYCKNNTSEDLKRLHQCGDSKICKFCYLIKETNHLCPLKIERVPEFHVRLAFFKIVVDENNLPFLAIFYREDIKRGVFREHIFFDKTFQCPNNCNDNVNENYLEAKWNISAQFKDPVKLQEKSSFCDYLNKLRSTQEKDFSQQLLDFLLDENFSFTAYLCEDTTSTNLVMKEIHSLNITSAELQKASTLGIMDAFTKNLHLTICNLHKNHKYVIAFC